jgi:formylmethanofuran dehydrogenase subunit D
MTTDEQGNESSQTPEERLQEIKREEKEDASGYYSQGDSKGNVNEAAEFNKPVAPMQAEKEEMNMLKAVAFLGFGMAALAIIFILFFVRDLDTRVVGMDGAVTSLEDKIAPLKKHVDDSLDKVNAEVSQLKNKVGNYERTMAVMELKRALVTVQGMSMGDSANVKAKSGEVVAGIEALLTELGAGTVMGMPAGIVSLEEAPVAPAPAVEEPAHAEEPAPVVEEAAHEEEPAHEEEVHEEASAEEESSDGEEEGDEEEDDDE